MDYSSQTIADYYDRLGLGEWERLEGTPSADVQLHIHNHYLRKHLHAGARVLDVGSGPGRFTILAWELEACVQPGYIDGGTHMIAVARRKENISFNG